MGARAPSPRRAKTSHGGRGPFTPRAAAPGAGSAPRRWTAPSRMWSNTSKVLILTKCDHWEPNVAYLKPLPEITELNRPFWDALKRHEFTVPRCEIGRASCRERV